MTALQPARPTVAFDRTTMLDELRAATSTHRPTMLTGVAEILAGHVGALDVLITAPAGEHMSSHIVHAEPGFSVVVLSLPPGGQTAVHDHLTWCAVAVVRGTEHESTYRDAGDHLEQLGCSLNLAGSITTLLPPGDIHRVRNDTDALAVSLHVYGADLRDAGSSVRRTYDLPVR